MTRFFTKCLGLLCLTVLCCFSLQQQVVAQCAAGEVNVQININTGNFASEVGWELMDGSGAIVASNCSYTTNNVLDCTQYCLDEGTTYNFSAFDSFGDSWNGGTYEIFVVGGANDGCELAAGSPANNDLATGFTCGTLQETATFDPGAPACGAILGGGCDDPTALNFDACAAFNDGTCAYPPTNDFCADAETIECGDFKTTDTSLATADVASGCVTGDGSGGGVWYKFTGTGEVVTASLCGSSFDTKIRVYTGTCGALVCETGNDDSFSVCGGAQSSVTWTSVAGTDYYILVHGFGGSEGLFQLTLDCEGCTNPSANNYSPTASVDDGSCEACTDPTAHNYVSGIANDDGSCETCDDGILNGDELDIDCGGALCDPCPCGIQVSSEIVVAEAGCGAGSSNRVVTVTFTGGIDPITYSPSSTFPVFISPKGLGVYQVSGNGTWSIEASDPSGCFQVADSEDMPYVSDTGSKNETAAEAEDGQAIVEASGGTPPYSVMWSDGSEGTIAESGQTHTLNGLKKGNYEATVTDADGNVAKACVYVGRNSATGGNGRGGRGGRGKSAVEDFTSLMAQPNPFSQSTIVRFSSLEANHATINVFALNGEQIHTLFDGQTEQGQVYNLELTSSNMPSGVYIIRLTTDTGIVQHQRIVVAK